MSDARATAHPPACLSDPDNRFVIFNCDRTDPRQVWAAAIAPRVLEALVPDHK